MRPQASEAARIWGLLCVNKMALALIVGAAVFTQLLLCLLFYLAGLSVGIHAPFLAWLTFVPIILAANAPNAENTDHTAHQCHYSKANFVVDDKSGLDCK